MNTKNNQGFTLHELMVCLCITALLAWGTTAVAHSLAKQRLQTAHSELAKLIQLTRTQALGNAGRVTLCPLQNGNRCQLPWAQTLTSFIDKNANRVLDPEDTVLAHIDIPEQIHLSWRGMRPTHSLHFSGSGMTAVSNGTFTLCQRSTDEIRRLVINKQGRLKSEREQQGCPL